MKMIIAVKQLGDMWCSFTTFKGYDYSEKAKTPEEAQGQMTDRLLRLGIKFEDIYHQDINSTPMKPMVITILNWEKYMVLLDHLTLEKEKQEMNTINLAK